MIGIDSNTFWQMSINEITLAIKGFKEFHSGKKESKPMTASDVEKLKERYPDF